MSQQLSLFISNNIKNPAISYPGPVIQDLVPKLINHPEKREITKKEKTTLTLVPTISINPSRICYYHQIVWQPFGPVKQQEKTDEEKKVIVYKHLLQSKRTADGQVSKIARRKMSQALDYLLLMAGEKTVTSQLSGRSFKFRIAFITLTLPSAQIHSDNEIKNKCLNSFLLEIKKFYKVKNYVWRAEQQKNGNLHFHLVLDKFIPWNELRNRWNRIINKLGYVERYRDNMRKFHESGFRLRGEMIKKWSAKQQRAAWKKGKLNDWHSPNSTDVHQINKIRNLKNYLSKYLTKNEEQSKNLNNLKESVKPQTGRIWGATQSLGSAKGAKIEMDNEIQEQMEALIERTECRIYEQPYFSVFDVNFEQLNTPRTQRLYLAFVRYLSEAFDYNVQLPITL